MARILVQLKLRLLANALRSSTAAGTTFIISTFFAIVVAVGGFYVLALFRGLSASVDLTTVIFTGFALAWLIAPILAFGLDGTLDPATLQLYPLRTRPLAAGLLAASAAGAWPAANLLALLGVTVGLAHRPAGPARRPDRCAPAGAVLHHAGPAGDHQHGQAAALTPRQGPRGLPDHPDLRPDRVAGPGDTQGSSQGRDHRGELPRRGYVDALATAGPGRARDPGRLARPSRHRADTAGAAGRDHYRAGLAVGTLAGPRPGNCRHLHRFSAAARYGAAAAPLRPARRRGGPVLDLPAPRAYIAGLLGHDRGHHGGGLRQHHLWPAPASRRGDRQRRRRRGIRRVLPRQLHRPDRPAVCHRGTRADQPPLPAGLLHRPEHRARRDRGTAAHRDLASG